jgi:hypothetical protein
MRLNHVGRNHPRSSSTRAIAGGKEEAVTSLAAALHIKRAYGNFFPLSPFLDGLNQFPFKKDELGAYQIGS